VYQEASNSTTPHRYSICNTYGADRKGAQAFLEANFNKWKIQKQLEKMEASKRSTT
jgi:hypothetical protein